MTSQRSDTPHAPHNEPPGKEPLPQAAPAAAAVHAAPAPLTIWQSWFVQNVLPFLTSLALHIAVITLAWLAAKAVQVVISNPVREQIIIPDAEMVADGPPGGIPHPGLGGDPTRDAAQNLYPDVPKDSKGIAEKPGLTSLPEMMGGAGDAEGPVIIGIGPGGLGGGGAGVGSGKAGGGNARRVVFVCDASGSMLSVFDDLRRQLRSSVEKLRPNQSFNVMFFKEQTVAAVDRNVLVMATADNKRKAFDFLDKMYVSSSTNPIPALELAFSQKPELLYLLTDGDFQGPGNEAVVRFCQQRTADGKTKINTIAFIPKDSQGIPLEKEFVKALETIARDSGGVFRHVNEEQMAGRE